MLVRIKRTLTLNVNHPYKVNVTADGQRFKPELIFLNPFDRFDQCI